ncbi:MAG: DUF2306 domain-containing protein [Devosia sp.]|uniref:DUF2306 domain-containing protein n=1 Tax=Devosia sp. TaxID=1871048 RepID=UPI0024CAFE21|nr:DUF2306 domain-containing protein [Devosia sp.]UYN99588.1 MAG: DUF2306 domain-containing protein [Devosia sp.]
MPKTRNFGSTLILSALVLLGFLPVLATIGRMIVRFGDVGAPADLVADSSRFFAMPTVVIMHVIGGCLFTLIGALQFSSGLRRGPWHRISGRVMVVAGLLAGVSSLALTQFYPPLPSDGPFLYWFRWAAGLGLVWSLAVGFRMARNRRFDQHRANMTRAYALGLGPSTQMLIGIPWVLVAGQPDPVTSDLLLGASWAINLAVAQWTLHRRSPGPGLARVST